MVDRLEEGRIQRVRDRGHVLTVGDGLEEVADVPAQLRLVHRDFHGCLPGAGGYQHPQARVGQEVHHQGGGGAEAIQLRLQPRGLNCSRAGALGRGFLRGSGRNETSQPLAAVAFGLALALEELVQALLFGRAQATVGLQATEAIDLRAGSRVDSERGGVPGCERLLRARQLDVAARVGCPSIAQGEVVQLLALEQLEHLEAFVDSPSFHQPIGDRAIDSDFVAQEATVQAAVCAAEEASESLDPVDRLFTEKDGERRLRLTVKSPRKLKVGPPKRIRGSQRGRGGKRLDCNRVCVLGSSEPFVPDAPVLVDVVAQRGVGLNGALQAQGSIVTVRSGDGVGLDLGPAQLVHHAQDRWMRIRQPRAIQLEGRA